MKETSFSNGENPPDDFDDIAFDYVYALLSRSPSFLKSINNNSSFFQFYSELDRHDIAAHDGYIMAKEKNLLGSYAIAFLDNSSDEELLLPTGGITQVGSRLLCPVTPRRAIVLDDIIMDSYGSTIPLAVYEISDYKTIHDINRLSVIQEQRRDGKYIVSRNKQLIEEIIDELLV